MHDISGIQKIFLPKIEAGQNWGMPDWKTASEYKFTESLTASGWAWEFMRRNKKYKADWAKASSGGGAIYNPPKKEEEADLAWRLRVANDGGDPQKINLASALGRKWGMTSDIQNPNVQQVPKFGLHFPIRLAYNELPQYFDDDEPFSPKAEFAVLVFDLRHSLRTQIGLAKTKLKELQKNKAVISSKNVSQKKWTTYLRLLDGEEAGAKPKTIREFMEAYHPKSKDPDDLKKATDKFSDHRKSAHALRDNPLSILP